MTRIEQRLYAYIAFVATPAPSFRVEAPADMPTTPYRMPQAQHCSTEAWLAQFARAASLHLPARIGRYGRLFDVPVHRRS